MAASKLLTALWCGEGEPRTMAARIIRTPLSSEPADLTMITQAEAQGQFFTHNGKTSNYLSSIKVEVLLNHFAELETAQFESHSPESWLSQNREALTNTASEIASNRIDVRKHSLCKVQMLDDMTSPNHLVGMDYRNENQLSVLSQVVQKIESYLKLWMSGKEEPLAELSLRAMSLNHSEQLLKDMIEVATGNASISKRLQAMDTIALYHTPQSQAAMRKLASNEHYLIRANAMQYLDPTIAEDRAILQNADKDPFLVVSETAKRRLTP